MMRQMFSIGERSGLQAGHDGASGPCSHMPSFLHDRALVGICRWHSGLCLLTVVSGSVPGPI